MPRKGSVPKRDVIPDPMYGNVLVTKFINALMLDGKRGVAESIMYGALEAGEEKTGTKAIEILEQAMNNVMPV
ncbi:MAG: 30S ribosomal protein S7, partial [Limnochordia bacterium]|nr:30S ribosomal protein S7 [Limnochordia bacterium]